MREFETGATRDNEEGKYDYEGFISPNVVVAYARYMHKHRVQADGQLRDSDNWQKGMPRSVYLKSALRHLIDVWLIHRGYKPRKDATLEDALCAVLFNVMGYLHEVLLDREP